MNETTVNRFVDFLLKLKELMRRHLVGSFGDRSGAWFQVDNELDGSNRRYPWEFFREASWKSRTTGIFSIPSRGVAFNAFKA